MGVRTTIGLGVVALGLLAYIVFFERGSITTGELDRRKDDVLPELVRERVTKIEVQRKGRWTVLERRPDPKSDLELGSWRLVKPIEADADEDAVESLLGALEWMSTRRRMEGVTAEDRKRFGFDAPRYRVWFTVGRKRFPVVVGKLTPQADGIYVQGDDRTRAHVVGKELVEALNHEPTDYHTKELHDGLSALTVTALTVRDAAGERRLTKRDETWWLGQGAERSLASTPEVEAAIDALDRLRAKRFVALEDAHAHGLDAPFLDAAVTRTRVVPPLPGEIPGAVTGEGGKPKTEEVVVRLRVGAECPGHVGERHVRADHGPVMCIAEADLADARKSVEAFRERRLVPFDETNVKAVRLERDGKVLALSRKDETWSYELRAGASVEAKGEAKAGSVVDWLKALANAKAESLAPDTGIGIAKPVGRLRVEREAEDAAYEVVLLSDEASQLRTRRGEEQWIAAYAKDVDALLAPSAARFTSAPTAATK
jgi:hypothetical protein